MPLVVENSRFKVGVDPDRGGAICWLGKGGSPENLLNAFDCGRFVQQSYYGADDGSNWNGEGWRGLEVMGALTVEQSSIRTQQRMISEPLIPVRNKLLRTLGDPIPTMNDHDNRKPSNPPHNMNQAPPGAGTPFKAAAGRTAPRA